MSGVIVLLICVLISFPTIAFLIALQWKCENPLGGKQPNFTETSTPHRSNSSVTIIYFPPAFVDIALNK